MIIKRKLFGEVKRTNKTKKSNFEINSGKSLRKDIGKGSVSERLARTSIDLGKMDIDERATNDEINKHIFRNSIKDVDMLEQKQKSGNPKAYYENLKDDMVVQRKLENFRSEKQRKADIGKIKIVNTNEKTAKTKEQLKEAMKKALREEAEDIKPMNKAEVFADDSKRFLKKNKKVVGIAGGAALTAGALYGAKKLYDRKKTKEL